MHYALEMMTAFDPVSVDSAVSALRNRYGNLLTPEETADIERRISALAASVKWHNYIKGAVLRREQPLAFGGKLKQIDLLLEWPDRTEVVDYKSSERFAEKHTEQVREYIKAVRGILHKPTTGMVVYLLPDTIKMVHVHS